MQMFSLKNMIGVSIAALFFTTISIRIIAEQALTPPLGTKSSSAMPVEEEYAPHGSLNEEIAPTNLVEPTEAGPLESPHLPPALEPSEKAPDEFDPMEASKDRLLDELEGLGILEKDPNEEQEGLVTRESREEHQPKDFDKPQAPMESGGASLPVEDHITPPASMAEEAAAPGDQTLPALTIEEAAVPAPAGDPVLSAPVVEEPAASAPAVDPALSKPAIEEPAASAPAVDPALSSPAVKELATPAPADDAALSKPAIEEPAASAPAVDPALSSPSIEEPATPTIPGVDAVIPAPAIEEPATPTTPGVDAVIPAPAVEEPAIPTTPEVDTVISAPAVKEPAIPSTPEVDTVISAPAVEEPATPPTPEGDAVIPAPAVEEPAIPSTPEGDAVIPVPTVEETPASLKSDDLLTLPQFDESGSRMNDQLPREGAAPVRFGAKATLIKPKLIVASKAYDDRESRPEPEPEDPTDPTSKGTGPDGGHKRGREVARLNSIPIIRMGENFQEHEGFKIIKPRNS